ncbi:MAG: hypothetical protein LBB98_04105 [Treponema sp.]|jgi:hypothetical protein|nr:hypothetical protein [Treponema sp.]
MTKKEKLDKICNDFSISRTILLGILWDLVFASDEMKAIQDGIGYKPIFNNKEYV